MNDVIHHQFEGPGGEKEMGTYPFIPLTAENMRKYYTGNRYARHRPYEGVVSPPSDEMILEE